MELNRGKGTVPLYFQIASILREQIENGEFAHGDLLYSEKQLQKIFNVSRITVRQAIGALTNEGYLQCSRGIGTTVIFKKIDDNLRKVISSSEEMKQHNVTMKTSYCDVSIEKANKIVATNLKIEEHEEVYKIIRVCDADGTPLVYSTSYLKKEFDYPLDPKMCENSLYHFLNTEYGIEISSGQDTLEAIIANEKISEFLGIPLDSPIFKRTRKAKNQKEEIIEYSVCYYPGNKYKYSVEL